jgi:hypothetical protein
MWGPPRVLSSRVRDARGLHAERYLPARENRVGLAFRAHPGLAVILYVAVEMIYRGAIVWPVVNSIAKNSRFAQQCDGI